MPKVVKSTDFFFFFLMNSSVLSGGQTEIETVFLKSLSICLSFRYSGCLEYIKRLVLAKLFCYKLIRSLQSDLRLLELSVC